MPHSHPKHATIKELNKNETSSVVGSISVSEEGQQNSVFGSNNEPTCHPHSDSTIDEATLVAVTKLGAVLRSIHNRLIREGYVIKNGVITKPYEPE